MTASNILFLIRHRRPIAIMETLDAAMVAAVFDQPVSLLFRDDGVGVLQAQMCGENNAPVEHLCSLQENGIDAIYVCRESLKARGLDGSALIIDAELVSPEEQHILLARQTVVIGS